MSLKAVGAVQTVPIYIDRARADGLDHLLRYPYVSFKQFKEAGLVKKSKLDKLFNSYKDDYRFDNHWFYYRANPRGYMVTLDLAIMFLEDGQATDTVIQEFRDENDKWLGGKQ